MHNENPDPHRSGDQEPCSQRHINVRQGLWAGPGREMPLFYRRSRLSMVCTNSSGAKGFVKIGAFECWPLS